MKKRIISILLVIAMVIPMLPIQAMASVFDDSTGHWAESSIERLNNSDIIHGSSGHFRPDDTITRAEVATIFDNLMDYQTATEKAFSDLSDGSWYTESMRKAVFADIFLGSGDGKINPEGNITRQEFFVTLARLLKLAEVTTNANFSDQSDIADWAVPSINALAKAGFVKGVSNEDNTYRIEPSRTITRGEVAVMIDRAFPGIYNSAKTYKDSVTGNAVVNKSNVKLSKMAVGGDLFISQGVANGEVTLDSVKVTGRTHIYGGGKKSVLVTGDSTLTDLIAAKNVAEGPLTIKLFGNTVVDTITVVKGSAQTTILIEGGSSVKRVVVDNNGTIISGSGEAALIIVTADNVSVDMPNTRVEVADGVNGTIVCGNEVLGGETVSGKGGGTGIPSVDIPTPVPPESNTYTVKFQTNGGAALKPLQIKHNEKLDPVPQAKKKDAIFLGWYTDSNFENSFYASQPLNGDITLYAKYGDMKKNQEQKVDSFALSDQNPDKTFIIKAPGMNAEEVKNAITVTNIGAGGTPELIVVDNGNGTFTIFAKDGFREGSAITLYLGDGLSFGEKDSDGNEMSPNIRNASFTIKKEEVNDIVFNSDIVEAKIDAVKEIKEPKAIVDDPATPDVENEGTFTCMDDAIGGKPIGVGTLITFYDTVKPEDRVNGDYSDDRIIYAKVVEVDSDPNVPGNQVVFETPDTKSVFELPESLPMDAADFIAGSYTDKSDLNFEISNSILVGYWVDYDHIGLSTDTTIDVGDTVVIFCGDKGADVTEENVVYGTVEKVIVGETNTNITFALTTPAKIMDNTQDYYSKQDADYEDIVAQATEAGVLEQIEQQALESNFAAEAMTYLAGVATKTKGYQKVAGSRIGPNVDITLPSFPDDWNPNVIIPPILLDGWTVQAKITTETDHFKDGGLMCQLFVKGTVEVPLSTDPLPDKLKIDLTATFQQELKLVVNVDGGIEWKWAAFIPYPADFYMNSNVDVFDYTAIKVHAIVSTIGGGIDLGELGGLKDLDISSEIETLLGLEGPEQMSGTQKLFDMYADMLQNETDYVTIIEQKIFDINMSIMGLLKVGIKADFVIKANVNLVLGSSLTYTSGNRYNFWFKLFSGQSGSSTTQLIDEQMKFQFYVMGVIGLKVGVVMDIYVAFVLPKGMSGGEFEVASTGFEIETGAYVELYGYFVYTVEALNKVSKSEMSGALYVDFGIYLEISFFARVADGIASYQPSLYDKKFPLLSAGDRINVYDFTYPEIPSEEKYIIKNYVTDYLPDSYWSMSGMDLMEGDLVDVIYPRDKFVYTLSNPAFKFDKTSGKVTVDVPNNTRYMECDMTVTWAGAKLAFSTGELRRTIHIVWTNLADEEMSLRHNISVVSDGKVIWSKVVGEGEEYKLPTQDELKNMLDYGTYMYKGKDLKYADNSTLTYTNEQGTNAILVADRDRLYTVNATPRTYNLVIKDVQNEDGTTSDLKLTTKFGEAFDLSELLASGTRNPELVEQSEGKPYTVYAKTICENKNAPLLIEDTTKPAPTGGKPIDAVIDSVFAKQLTDGTYTYAAQYNDNFVTATFKFVDSRGKQLSAPVEVKVENDSYPEFDYQAYVLNMADGKKYMVKRFNKEIGKLTADETFTGICILALGDPIDITFDTGADDVNVAPISRHYGAHLTLPRPIREGYSFAGWFTNIELTTPFTDTNMSNDPVTLYAKWTANMYKVHFNTNATGSAVSSTPEDSIATYGDQYKLPDGDMLRRSGYILEGWFTTADGGKEVANVETAENHTLYAHWTPKVLIGDDYLKKDKISVIYNKEIHPFQLVWNAPKPITPAAEPTTPAEPTPPVALDSFTVQYKGKNPNYSPNKWLTINPKDCEQYDIMLYRPEDDTHQMFKQIVVDGLIINKATRENFTITPPKTIVEKTYNTITVSPAVFEGDGADDGTMMYQSQVWFEFIGQSLKLSESVWSTSLTVPIADAPSENANLCSQRIYCKFSDARNYFDTTITTDFLNVPITEIPAKDMDKHQAVDVKLSVNTPDEKDAGTNYYIYFHLQDANGNDLDYTQLDNKGDDFKRNSTGEYTMQYNIVPWRIAKMQLRALENSAFSDMWKCAYFDYSLKNSIIGDVTGKIQVNAWLGHKDTKQFDLINTPNPFKRNITSVGEFSKWGGNYVVDANTTGTINYKYDGMVTDQYGTYNVYTHDDSANITLQINNPSMRSLVSFGNYGITIDKAKIYQRMLAAELDTVTFTVKLIVPEMSCINSNDEMFTKTITITRE